MSSVRRKPARALLCLVLALSVAAVFLLSSSAVFAETMQPSDYKVISDLHVTKDIFKHPKKITGTVDLDKTITISNASLNPNNNKYEGSVNCSVEAADLFAGAYEIYQKDIQGKTDYRGRKYENIVMFDQGGAFPTAQYTVKFPANVHIDENAIRAEENTATVSGITKSYDRKENTVTISIKLGNWNDYKGFFDLVASEQGQSSHKIEVNIPYSVDAANVNATSNTLGSISGSGLCSLYKCSGFGKGEIVHITTSGNGSKDLTK
jgi:hypothetical protein